MKFWRLIFGGLLIAAILWIIVGEQLSGASADAVVNAELTTIRAPIAGRLDMDPYAFGVPVAVGEELGTVTDPVPDSVRRDDLEVEYRQAVAAKTRLESALEAVEAQRATQADRRDRYTKQRIAELETRLDHARARLDLLEGGAETDELTAALDQGQSGADDTPQLEGVALEFARERVETLEITLASARDGIFLGDGYNDAPFAGQYLAELDLRAATMQTEIDEADANQTAILSRLINARLRANRLAFEVLTSPARGLVWERLARSGETVERGQDVMHILDCDSVIVTLSVTEDVYARISTGTEARFRLSGSGEVMPGTVLRLAGTGAETIYRNLAISPSQRHLERYDVTLLVPELRNTTSASCLVGRAGRAFFDSRPLDVVRDLFR